MVFNRILKKNEKKMKMKIKVKYNSTTNIVNGYFPENVNYKNNAIDTELKTIDGEPYVEITQEEWEANRAKQMVVENGIYKEYVKSDNELLQEAKSQAIGNRKHYLKNSGWYYESDTIPQGIKDKRILARTGINQIEQETDINNIVIDFN